MSFQPILVDESLKASTPWVSGLGLISFMRFDDKKGNESSQLAKSALSLLHSEFKAHILLSFSKGFAFLRNEVTSAILRISGNSPLFKHRLKFSVITIANKSSNSFIILVGISLNLISRFFISLITSVLSIYLKQNIRLRIVTILGWFSNLAMTDSTFFVSDDEVRRRFFTILTKNLFSILANSLSF